MTYTVSFNCEPAPARVTFKELPHGAFFQHAGIKYWKVGLANGDAALNLQHGIVIRLDDSYLVQRIEAPFSVTLAAT